MRKNYLLILLSLLWAIDANALIVSVNGHGDVPAEGLELTIDEAEEDPLSGEMRMELNGNLLSNGALTVTITRSKSALTDEFCCAGQCVGGNGETTETLTFNPEGPASWFAHYTPKPDSRVTVIYRFEDSSESRTLTVHYHYAAQGVEAVESEAPKATKIVQEGILYIIRDNKKYSIL